jgi:hypothetical protein
LRSLYKALGEDGKREPDGQTYPPQHLGTEMRDICQHANELPIQAILSIRENAELPGACLIERLFFGRSKFWTLSGEWLPSRYHLKPSILRIAKVVGTATA